MPTATAPDGKRFQFIDDHSDKLQPTLLEHQRLLIVESAAKDGSFTVYGIAFDWDRLQMLLADYQRNYDVDPASIEHAEKDKPHFTRAMHVDPSKRDALSTYMDDNPGAGHGFDFTLTYRRRQ